jgi:hypothetical protein
MYEMITLPFVSVVGGVMVICGLASVALVQSWMLRVLLRNEEEEKEEDAGRMPALPGLNQKDC